MNSSMTICLLKEKRNKSEEYTNEFLNILNFIVIIKIEPQSYKKWF